MPGASKESARRARVALVVVPACAAYAIARYNVFGDVATANLPVYVLNKAVSFGAVIFLLVASYRQLLGEREAARFWGLACLHASAAHVLMSLAVLDGSYFERFYTETGRMNLTGEASILAGVIAACCFLALTQGGLKDRTPRRLKLCASACIALHLLVMGLSGWLRVDTWPGGLPPISLLSFVATLGAATASLFAFRREKRVHGRFETG